MNTISDIVAQPLIPIELIAALALLAAAMIGFALWRGLKGAWLRLAAALTLLVGLLDPAALEEERDGLSDVAVVLIDESQSQTIEDRAAVTDEASTEIVSALEALSVAREGADPIDLRVVRVAGDGEDGTRLVSALGEAVSDVPNDRLAGAVLITDGAVEDGDRVLQMFSGDAPPPVHVLLTGREDEYDRRLVVENAPTFGLVGDQVVVRFRVEETGAPSTRLPAPRVTLFLDGRPIRAALSPLGQTSEIRVDIEHGGSNVVELRAEVAPGELTERNNLVAFSVNGVRDRLRVLLVSGEPYAGERTWRNLLKSDPSIDLVHFTILRPPRKLHTAPAHELALIPFPTTELFERKLDEFELIVFDRYRRWGILETQYIRNIANYVREGGAVLVATGPAFAGLESIYRSPLAEILPAAPTSDVIETAFQPKPTELGDRHPVTQRLPGSQGGQDGAPSWGRWFRQIEVATLSGDVLLEGSEQRPLLVLDRVGEGRVAMLASDHAWLWARGYDGGGPQAELLRRLAHWMMKEPELEEEALTTNPADGGFTIERRSLALGEKSVIATSPSGVETTIALNRADDGVWRGQVETEELGLHRLRDADESEIGPEPDENGLVDPSAREPLSTIAVVGPPSPREFANPISTPDRLEALADATGGAMIRLRDDGVPTIRRVREGRATEGSDWIGLPRREAYTVTSASLDPLAPSWALFALSALFAVAAWRVEGRLRKIS